MSLPALYNIVNGKMYPKMETLEKIAEALEVPMWQLFASPEEARKESGASVCPYCGGLLDVEVNLKKKGYFFCPYTFHFRYMAFNISHLGVFFLVKISTILN
ncbi:helix-turn-helix domain-containing protein [Phocaeicola coprocola]